MKNPVLSLGQFNRALLGNFWQAPKSEAGRADYLVTGDRSGLLALARHRATRIISARDFIALFA